MEEGKQNKRYKCKKCSKSYKGKGALINHENIHTEKYKCNVCEQCFECDAHLKTHARVHSREKPYKCPHCDNYYSHKSNLTSHVRRHTGDKPYKCTDCDKNFATSTELGKHARTHLDTKGFKCDVCLKLFSQPHTLKNHMRLHTGEKPYQCDVCERRFYSNLSLNMHKISHTGVKDHYCGVCNKAYFKEYSLKRHMKIHTKEKPFQCAECDQRFRNEYWLKRHQLVHSDVKDYKCELCERLFKSLHGLKRHGKEHHEEKQFECNQCDKAFAYHSSLKTHERLSHSRPKLKQEFRPIIMRGEQLDSIDIAPDGIKEEDLTAEMDPLDLQNAAAPEEVNILEITPKEELSTSIKIEDESQDLANLTSIYKDNCLAMNIKTEDQLQCDICLKTFSDTALLSIHQYVHCGSSSSVEAQPNVDPLMLVDQLTNDSIGIATNIEAEKNKLEDFKDSIDPDMADSVTVELDPLDENFIITEVKLEPEQDKIHIASESAPYKQTLTKSSDVIYPCDQCDYVFIKKSFLSRHKTCKHPVKYPCDQCGASFARLSHHKKSKHGAFSYPCDRCEFKAVNQNKLKRHKWLMH